MPVRRARESWLRVAGAASVKVFDLCCDADHLFEGWFASQEQFDSQMLAHQIACPLCGSALIRRRPSASHLKLGPVATPVAVPESQPVPQQSALARAALRILAATEDVGERFAEEARRIHYKEVPERPIRGVATLQQAQALEEEGVQVVALPFPGLAKGTVQ